MARVKIPSPFRKPYAESKYEKKIRRRIYLDTDRSFLDSIVSNEAGKVTISRELSRDEAKRLKKLVSAAKKNRGAVRTGKLVLLVILVGAVLVFSLVFKNRLVERGAERLLTDLFAAKADVIGLVFRPIAGEISFDTVVVADADRPMRNLFTLGKGRLAVDTWRLVNGNVIIRDLTVSGLDFGTERSASGAIAESPAPTSEAAVPADTTLSLASLGLPDTLDATAFVEHELDLLDSPVLVTGIVDSGSSYVSRWSDRLNGLAASGTATATQIANFATTDFTAIRSVDDAIALVNRANSLLSDTTAYADTVRDGATGAIDEASAIIKDAANVPAVIQADYEHVLERVPAIAAEGTDFLTGLIEPFLRARLGAWYDRIQTARGIIERLPRDSSAKSRTGRRTGRIVDFGSVRYPVFELDQGFFSAEGARPRDLLIENASSDPEITGSPLTVTYHDGSPDGETVIGIGAIVDGRPNAVVPLALNATVTNAPIDVRDGFDSIGIDGIAGTGSIDVSLAGDLDDSSGSVAISGGDLSVLGSPSANSIGGLLAQILEAHNALDARFSFAYSAPSAITFSDAATNLDSAIADVVQTRIDAMLADFRARVRTELDAQLAPYLDSLQSSVGDVVDVRDTASELIALATDRESAAAALQAKATSMADSLASALEDEAKRRLDEARAAAEAAAKEQADRVQAQVEASAQAQVDAATREAESAVQNQVETIRDAIKLPGF